MARKMEVMVGGVTGIGRNKTEAREDAEQKIDMIVNHGNYTPFVIAWRGCVAIIHRMPHWDTPWWYRIVELSDGEYKKVDACGMLSGDPSDRENEARIRHHISQYAWSPGDDPTNHCCLKENGSRDGFFYANDFERWAKWQNLIRDAINSGYNTDFGRAYADAVQNDTVNKDDFETMESMWSLHFTGEMR